MKKIWLISIIIAAMAVPFVSSAQVEVGSGTMQIGGKIKWLYTYIGEDEDAQGMGAGTLPFIGTNYWGGNGIPVENFATTNVEIDINGVVGENVAYVIELQSASGNALWASGPNDMGALGLGLGTVGVRQAYMVVSDVIPMTDVVIGTGIGPVSVYQQRATNDLDLIMLPLLNIAVGGASSSGIYPPVGVGWQGTGALMAIKPMDMVELDIAYYNGVNMVNLDVDLEKAWAVKLAVMPMEGAKIELAYLDEGWQEDVRGFSGNVEHQHASGYVISGQYVAEKLEANFDYLTMTGEDLTMDKKGIADLTWMGYQVTAGFWVTETIELLLRYEFIDPNTENDKKSIVQSEYDDLTLITLGANMRLNENAEVAFNYIMTQEPGDKIDVGSGDEPYGGPTPDIKYQQIDDDIMLIQVQVWQ